MKTRSQVFRGALLLVGVVSAGCGNIEISGLNQIGFGGAVGLECPTDPNSAANYLILSPSNPLYVLVGDTASSFAHRLCRLTDSVSWRADRAIISVATGPEKEDGALGGPWWHVTIRGDSVGTTMLTATSGVSASVSVTVVPAANLRAFTVDRRCNIYSAPGRCPVNGQFNDTLMVGDTASVFSHLTDIAGHEVSSTVKWSTSSATVGAVAIDKRSIGGTSIVVAAGAGDATITATAAGFSSSFVLHVVK